MSKTSLMVLAVTLCLSQTAAAITNAELARLNNELIGLDAQLAVAKKKSELEKYRVSGGVSPVRSEDAGITEPKSARAPKHDADGEPQGQRQPDSNKRTDRKSRAQ